MNRLLLTLLALLTGLVTQTAPAHAALRSAGETEVGAVEIGRPAAQPAPMITRVSVFCGDLALPRLGGSGIAATVRSVPLKSVLIGIDRARE